MIRRRNIRPLALRLRFRSDPMDTSYERTLHSGLNPGWTRTLSRLDEVGADVRLRARFADLADEDVNSTEGDPVPVLD